MSDTPRTDHAYRNHPWDMHDSIPLEFCRQLERELTEARDALEFRRELYALQTDQLDDVRDQLREEQRLHVQTLNERDDAREYADKLAQGLPDGMLPKDVDVLREANLGLAVELAEAQYGWADEIRKGQAELRNAETIYNAALAHRDIAIKQRDTLAEAALFLADAAEENTDDGDLWRSAIDNVRNLAGMTEEKYIETLNGAEPHSA